MGVGSCLHGLCGSFWWLWHCLSSFLACQCILRNYLVCVLVNACGSGQLTPQTVGGLRNLGLTIGGYVTINIAIWIDLIWIGIVISIMATQIYRYIRVSNLVQRQQTKWVVFAIIIGMLVEAVFAITAVFFPSLSQPGSLYWLLYNNISFYALLLVPLSLFIAILRYRLWDIDNLINRTLVYGTLTVLLALVYFGLIFALQFLLRGVINQTNDVVIVVSTLAIAALFQPLRRGIQGIIDLRFYRRKYDAVKTLEAFSATLRNEVDLDQLSEHLVAVVKETMQPAHVSLWLRTHNRREENDEQTRV